MGPPEWTSKTNSSSNTELPNSKTSNSLPTRASSMRVMSPSTSALMVVRGRERRLNQEAPSKPGVYMADHPYRYTCGLTGTMYYKVDKSGNRLPPPPQKKPQKAEKVVVKKDDKKKKGKK